VEGSESIKKYCEHICKWQNVFPTMQLLYVTVTSYKALWIGEGAKRTKGMFSNVKSSRTPTVPVI
jgi:hypothetical protein